MVTNWYFTDNAKVDELILMNLCPVKIFCHNITVYKVLLLMCAGGGGTDIINALCHFDSLLMEVKGVEESIWSNRASNAVR